MRSARAIFGFLSFVAACALAPKVWSQSRAPSQHIVIAASTLLDGKGRVLRDTRIVIEGSRIVAVGPGSSCGLRPARLNGVAGLD